MVQSFLSVMGTSADIIFVLVQTDKSKGTKGLALFAVDKNTPGFSASKSGNGW